jgi:hypothetical protein
MFHKARQIFEITPEGVNLFGRTIHHAARFCVHAFIAVRAELFGGNEIERGNS